MWFDSLRLAGRDHGGLETATAERRNRNETSLDGVVAVHGTRPYQNQTVLHPKSLRIEE
jgi:hypothetical protein